MFQEVLYLPPPFSLPFPPPLPLPLPLHVASPSPLPVPSPIGFGCCVRLGFRAFACALSATQHVVGRAYVRASGCVVVAMGCGVDAAERVAVWRNVAGRA